MDQDFETIIQEEGSYVYIVRNWLTRRITQCVNPHTLQQVYDILSTKLPYTRPQNRFQSHTPRGQFAAGDPELSKHSYSGFDVQMNNWHVSEPPVLGLLDVRNLIAADPLLMKLSGNSVPNSCLVNYYENGLDNVGYHPDKECKDPTETVYTITLGCPRRFLLKHNESKRVVETLPLAGDLVIMTGNTQKLWKHSIPKIALSKCNEGRISITYRTL